MLCFMSLIITKCNINKISKAYYICKLGTDSKVNKKKSQNCLGRGAEPGLQIGGQCADMQKDNFFTQTWFEPTIFYPKKCVNYNKSN